MKTPALILAAAVAVPSGSVAFAAERTPSPTAAVETKWSIDASHSSAMFRVRHLMVSNVKGELGPVSGVLHLNEQNVERSRVEVSIDATKINTRDDKRDEHLRSADFLDTSKYPAVKFISTRVKKAGHGLQVTGDLTIKDVTKPVVLNVDALPPSVKDPWGNTKRGATARTKINRKDFGLTWNMALEAGGVVVGDAVEIELEVELVQQKAGES